MEAQGLRTLDGQLENSSRIDSQRLLRVGIEERHEEEWDITLPWNATKSAQINGGMYVTITVGLVRNQEFSGVGGVMKVPSTAPD